MACSCTSLGSLIKDRVENCPEVRFVSLTLIIGNHNYSSWSLRLWLYLKESQLDFQVVRIPLHEGDWRAEVAQYTPSGRVPVLIDGDVTVWDTLAIIEHLRENHPSALDWPSGLAERAHARSISAEMHSGFIALRGELPQNLRLRRPVEPSDLCRQQIDRLLEIWSDCRTRYGERGPWLFGELSPADVMFVPVALRFVTYGIDVPRPAVEFVDAVRANEYVREWIRAAEQETEKLAFVDELRPGDMLIG